MKSSQRVLLEPAYLLHQRDWRDSSRIVDLYSRDHGRVTLFAKGVRRAGSPFASLLQPFVPLLVSWSGSDDGGTFVGAELAGLPASPAPACLMSAFYLNELMLRLLGREDPQPEIFEIYALALRALVDPAAEARALRLFEKRLLEALGVGVDYSSVLGSGDRVLPDRYYHVRAEQGVVGLAERRDAANVYRGADLLSLAGEDLADPVSLAAARRILREALVVPLEGRELSTRQVARAVRPRRTVSEEPSG
jgi:DNA repair protein RecO (recombination protein O)